MSTYRDEGTALAERLRALGAALEARERRVTKAFWAALPAATREEYRALRPRCAPEGRAVAHLAAAAGAAERCLALLDDALASLPALEAEWNAPPPWAPSPRWQTPRLRLIDYEDETLALAHALLDLARRHDPDAALVRGPAVDAVMVRLAAGGMPVVLGVEFVGEGSAHNSNVGPLLHATTGVSRATAPLTVRAEGWADGLRKALHIVREYELGDPLFDNYFFVVGEHAVARALLTEEVRAALLAIARVDVPYLAVGDGAARLSWRFEPTADAVDAALAVLRGLRAAPPTVPLLEA